MSLQHDINATTQGHYHNGPKFNKNHPTILIIEYIILKIHVEHNS